MAQYLHFTPHRKSLTKRPPAWLYFQKSHEIDAVLQQKMSESICRFFCHGCGGIQCFNLAILGPLHLRYGLAALVRLMSSACLVLGTNSFEKSQNLEFARLNGKKFFPDLIANIFSCKFRTSENEIGWDKFQIPKSGRAI